MPKSSPEKLAAALRANLRRRKGPEGRNGPQDGRAAKHAPNGSLAPEPALAAPKPTKNEA